MNSRWMLAVADFEDVDEPAAEAQPCPPLGSVGEHAVRGAFDDHLLALMT